MMNSMQRRFTPSTRTLICVHLSLIVHCLLVHLAFTTSDNDVSESNGLVIDVIQQPVKCERKSQNGNTLKIIFEGYLKNGTEFDASREDGFSFVLGSQRVIKGWNLGLVNMCVGEKRRLVVPPHLGYEQHELGEFIQSNDDLLFDIELLELSEVNETEGAFDFKTLDLDGDGLLQRDEITDYLKNMALHLEELATQMDSLQGQNDLVSKIMEIHDKNGDGGIGEDEFYSPNSEQERQEL